MQIIFDSRFDSVADMHHMRDMLTAYIASRETASVNAALTPTGVPHKGHEAPTGPRNVIQGGVEFDEKGEAVAIHQTSLNDPLTRPRPDAAQPLSFTPGDVSGSAPSPAGAAQSPIAHEEPADGVPMPPTVASVPAPPTVAPGAPAGLTTSAPSGDVDATGLPWDKRIHSSSKAKNADGSWRKLRGLNDGALVARVEAELRARTAAGAEPAQSTVAVPTPPPAGAAPVPSPSEAVQHAAQVFAGTVPAAVIPPPPGTTVAPPVPAAPDVATPEGLMEWVTPRMMDGRLTFDTVAAALQANGVESLAALKTNPAAVPGVYAALGGT